MAGTGIIWVLYLIAHMYGNLKIFAGQESFDEYAHHLRTMGTPLLPHRGLLTITEVILVLSILLHIVAAVMLWRRNRNASGWTSGPGGRRYQSTKNRVGVQRSYATFTLRWGGVVIALFIIFHLLNFTWDQIHPAGPSDSEYLRVIGSFSTWYMVLAYTIAMLAVGFHLWHGVWSALTTLGQNRSTTRKQSNLTWFAWLVSVVITIGFLLPPFAIFFFGLGQ